jgi:hypothetical protein
MSISSVIMRSIDMLSVAKVSVIIVGIIITSVIMPNVVAPKKKQFCLQLPTSFKIKVDILDTISLMYYPKLNIF